MRWVISRSTNFIRSLQGERDSRLLATLAFCVLPVLPLQVSGLTSAEIEVALVILVAALFLGILVRQFRHRAMLKGFEGQAKEIQKINKALKGRIYRQFDDLMLEGTYHHWPIFIRLSHSLETPGLYIQIPVPTRVTLFVVPVKLSDKHQAGKAVLMSSDAQFDARVVIRSDQPIQARMLLSADTVLQELPRLCCSSNTLVSMATGLLEVSEPLIPQTDLGYHVVSHIRSMAKVAAETAKIEGSPKTSVPEGKTKTRRLVPTVAVIAAFILIGLFVINRSMQSPRGTKFASPGISANDAALIPSLEHWRLAGAEDFDPQGMAWLQSQGKDITGHIVGRFAGESAPNESAYILVSDDGRQPPALRVVAVINQAVRFDKTYPSIAVVKMVRKSDILNVAWKGALPMMPPDGDGILIVPKFDDPGSASIVFIHEKQMLLSGTPADFHTVSIQ